MPDVYYLKRGEEVRGPLSRLELMELGERGQVLENDLIKREDIDRWIRAIKVKGLKTGTTISAATDPPPVDAGQDQAGTGNVSVSHEDSDAAGVDAVDEDLDAAIDEDFKAAAGRVDEDIEMKGFAGKVLKYIASTIIIIGVIDFTIYNTNMWDIYLGFLIGSSLEYWTYWIAVGVGFVLMLIGSKDLNCPNGVIWSVNIIAATAVVALITANIMTLINNPRLNNINLIRASSLELCPTRTIDEMVNSFFEDPKWSSYSEYNRRKPKSERGSFVILTGDLMFDGIPQEADITFKFTEWEQKGRGRSSYFEFDFEFHSIQINGIEQSEAVGLDLLDLMCETR
ncbi:MAG: hypothetical protein CMJ39_02315 [Phycisphaerae bacterium]|nr:hypothetical protein [Phycisphaerae bacterium]|tara:strand:+ start:683 stop:1705 length:1023 start_codon:yes stop_codon:yes gene_type:complete